MNTLKFLQNVMKVLCRHSTPFKTKISSWEYWNIINWWYIVCFEVSLDCAV